MSLFIGALAFPADAGAGRRRQDRHAWRVAAVGARSASLILRTAPPAEPDPHDEDEAAEIFAPIPTLTR